MLQNGLCQNFHFLAITDKARAVTWTSLAFTDMFFSRTVYVHGDRSHMGLMDHTTGDLPVPTEVTAVCKDDGYYCIRSPCM